ncbi:hypothetical protein ACFQRB_16680 [Halobaculum litoreum]|uniref:Uncharacterized protein n=1 Tax=Halobaculum litoreum TaxID=3031998 RepID=A0ABD5XR55_9EURY
MGAFFSKLGVQERIPLSEQNQGYRTRADLNEAITDTKSTLNWEMPTHLQVEAIETHLPRDETVRKNGYNGLKNEFSWMKKGGQGQGCKYGLVDAKIAQCTHNDLQAALTHVDSVQVCEHFLKMLDFHWDDYYSEFAFIKAAWAVDKNPQDVELNQTTTPTSFFRTLQTVAWLPCEDKSHRCPDEVYVQTSETEHADVPILTEQIPEGLRDCLGVQTEIGPERSVNVLKDIVSSWKAGEIKKINKFCDRLEYVKKHLNALSEEEAEGVLRQPGRSITPYRTNQRRYFRSRCSSGKGPTSMATYSRFKQPTGLSLRSSWLKSWECQNPRLYLKQPTATMKSLKLLMAGRNL